MSSKQKGWIFVAFQILIVAAVIISSFIEKKYTGNYRSYALDYLAFFFLSLGFLLGMISFINFGQKITPNPVPGEHAALRTTGIYSRIRHPIYLSALLLLLGFIFFFGAFYSLFIYIIAIAFIVIKIRFEEKYLIIKFPEYENYKKHTKKLLPYIY